MKKITKILCPTDFSETALNAFRFAIWFADKCGAEIELIHYVSPELAPADIPVVSGELTQQKVEIAKEVMQTFINSGLTQAQTAHSLESVPNVKADVEVGSPSNYVCEKAADIEADLILMATHSDHSPIERIFGSVTTAIMNKASRPVLIVPDKASSDKIQRVAFASDLKESDLFHLWEVIQLLEPFNASIKVAHVEDDEKDEIALDEIKAFFSERTTGEDLSFYNLIGNDTISALESFIEQHGIDMMVMYKPKRSFFERLFHTSLTRQFALNSDIPLLILN